MHGVGVIIFNFFGLNDIALQFNYIQTRQNLAIRLRLY